MNLRSVQFRFTRILLVILAAVSLIACGGGSGGGGGAGGGVASRADRFIEKISRSAFADN